MPRKCISRNDSQYNPKLNWSNSVLITRYCFLAVQKWLFHRQWFCNSWWGGIRSVEMPSTWKPWEVLFVGTHMFDRQSDSNIFVFLTIVHDIYENFENKAFRNLNLLWRFVGAIVVITERVSSPFIQEFHGSVYAIYMDQRRLYILSISKLYLRSLSLDRSFGVRETHRAPLEKGRPFPSECAQWSLITIVVSHARRNGGEKG